MKNIIGILLVLCLAVYLKDIIHINPNEESIEHAINTKRSKKKIRVSGMGIGATNDPNNRRNWTARRLVNPTTGKTPTNMRARELNFASQVPLNTNIQTDWLPRGPFNVGGRTRAIVVDVRDENTIMAGGVSGGIWRSEDSGISWTKLTSPDMVHNVTCLKQDQREGHRDTWYYGSGEAYGNSASGNDAYFFGNGLYKSVDNGETWFSLESTASNSPVDFDEIWDLVWDIEIDHSNMNSDIIYAATYGAIHRSDDGGESWDIVLGSNNSSYYFSEVEITSTGVVYAALSSDGSQKGIWRSDNGIDWVNILPDDWAAVFDRIRMAINPSNENEVYVIAVTPNVGQASTTFLNEIEHCSLWKYTYNPEDTTVQLGSWEDKSMNIPSGLGSNFDNFYAQGSYNLMIEVSPHNSDHILLGGTNLYVSTDGFSSLDNINQIGGYQKATTFPDFQIYDNHHPDQHEVLFSPTDSKSLISANDGGIFETTDYLANDVEWRSLNNGYYTTQLYTATINQSNPTNSLLGGFQDNGNFYTRSENIEDEWVMPLNGDGSFAHFVADETISYMSIQNGKVFKILMDDDGHRIAHRRIDPAGAEEQLFIHPFVVDPSSDSIIYYPGISNIWRNKTLNQIDLTNEWDSISDGWEQMMNLNLSSDQSISSISVSYDNPTNRLYVGTNKKEIYRIDNANSSSPEIVDVTSNYSPGQGMSSGDFFSANAYVNHIAIHPTDANVAMAVFSNYEVYSLYYTTNGGGTWQRAGGNLEQNTSGAGDGPSCRWASIMPFGQDTLYFVATSTGLYATEKIEGDATSWMQMGANTIGNVVCEQVKTRSADSLVVLATHGNGIYTTKIQSVNDVISVSEFNKVIDLKVYPNPSSKIITINSYAQETCYIYSLSGKLILQEPLDQGTNQIDVSKLSSGTYVIRLGERSTKFIKN